MCPLATGDDAPDVRKGVDVMLTSLLAGGHPTVLPRE
jgi:hypothetical protein